AMRPIKRSAELQKRFIATVSHELRTPLTVAKNTAEVALRNDTTLTREKAIGVIKSSLEEMERITDIIQFLLTFSNLEQRTKNFILEQVSLEHVARSTITLAQKNMQGAGVQIQLRADVPGYVSGSATALEELLLNLVRNAITFTPEGKRVEVHIHEGDSGIIRLCVLDEGPGIPVSDIPNLFEPFFQGSAIPAHETHGIGLGLSIVREIAVLHNAEVTVENRSTGGSKFCVVFPAISRGKDSVVA
ncbi:HAMP domain-containing histidine kinase, partial [Patescibacteria group bacterium]|nr:HAMP domain-containing histidine kinase [Patescibacteria group bacterium]